MSSTASSKSPWPPTTAPSCSFWPLAVSPKAKRSDDACDTLRAPAATDV
ncbi:MAG: hypothetical protein HQ525_11325 [Anaerolineae bacterium]|nr:hypothetical protein [Anaerolineae bacterium]